MLHQDGRLRNFEGSSICVTRDVEHGKGPTIIGLDLDRLPSEVEVGKGTRVVRIRFEFYLGLGACDSRQSRCDHFTEHDI